MKDNLGAQGSEISFTEERDLPRGLPITTPFMSGNNLSFGRAAGKQWSLLQLDEASPDSFVTGSAKRSLIAFPIVCI